MYIIKPLSFAKRNYFDLILNNLAERKKLVNIKKHETFFMCLLVPTYS